MNNDTDQNSFPRHVATTARALFDEQGTTTTLKRALELAVEFIPGAEDASISLLHRDGGLETPAATSSRAEHVDRLQYEIGTGPCVDALSEREIISVPDLEAERRWGSWGPRTVAETATRSMLSFRLFTNEHMLGALNLYATKPHAFTPDDLDHGQAFAAQAAVALARARKLEDLGSALDSRAVIGQALGILMERYQLDGERAFEVLVRISQHANRKLRGVAAELIETRQLPHDPQLARSDGGS